MENGQLIQEIWEKVSSIDTRIAVIDEKLTSTMESTSDHETRLRSIEKKIYVFSGASAIVGWLAGRMWK